MRTLTRTRARSREDAGLSLVEVMIAMTLFALGSLSLLSVLSSSTRSTFDNRARLVAANLAAADIDEARSTGYYDLVGTTTPREVQVDGRTYFVSREVAVTTAGGTAGSSSCVTSGSARQLNKRVSTSVTTTFRGKTRPVRADTVVKAPVFDPNSTKGAIGFLVLNRSGTPLPGLPVAVPSKSRTTDSNGCAFLDDLDPGTYTVTVTRAGSVTRDGRTTLTKNVTVNPGQITSDSMRVDAALTVTVRARAFSSASTVATGGPWSMPSQSKAVLQAPDRATSTAITNVDKKTLTGADLVWTAFPSPGGYDASIGACSVVTHLDSEPSTSPVVDLPFSPVTLHLVGPDSRTRSRSIRATWVPQGTWTPACSEDLVFSALSDPLCNGNSNGASGCYLNVALPQGVWNVVTSGADGAAVTGASPGQQITVGSRTPLAVDLTVP